MERTDELERAFDELDRLHGVKRMGEIEFKTSDPQFITNLQDACQCGGKIHVTIPGWTGHCTTREWKALTKKNGFERSKKEKSMKGKKLDPAALKANRFYVGSRLAIERRWGKASLKEAIKQGETLLESTGDEQFIVKIVKRVRRKPQPILVEDVK